MEERAAWAANHMHEAAAQRAEADKAQLLAELRQLQRDVNDLSEQLEEGQQREVELEASLEEQNTQQAVNQGTWRVWEAEMGARLAIVEEEQAAVWRLWERHTANQATMAGRPGVAVAMAGQVEQQAREERAALEASEAQAMLSMVAEMHAGAVARMEGERGWEWEVESGAEQPEAQQPVTAALQMQLQEAQAGHVAWQQRHGQSEVELAALEERQQLQEAEQAGRLGLLGWFQAGAVQRLAAMEGEVRAMALESEGTSAVYQRDVEEVVRSTELMIGQERAGWQLVVAEQAGRLAVWQEESSMRLQLVVPLLPEGAAGSGPLATMEASEQALCAGASLAFQ